MGPHRFFRVLLLVTPLLGAAPLLGSCAAARTRNNLSYADRARREYEAANELYTNGDLLDALERFQRVKRDYGLSRWGWLAELRVADIEVRQEHFTQAIAAYRTWLRYHPTQPEVSYAHFQIARCHYLQIPNDWFLIPASWERDDSTAHDALEEFQNFVRDYPDSEQAAEARTLLQRVRELLARQELHIGDFYRSRERWDAAASRYRTVLEEFQGSGLEAEALVRIGETFLAAGRRYEARENFEATVRNHGSSGWATSARNYLRHMGPPTADERRPASATGDGGDGDASSASDAGSATASASTDASVAPASADGG